VRTEPCGSIRRVNVEIPTLSVSDMKRLKATDKVGTFTLFQETYHRWAGGSQACALMLHVACCL
jgi:2-iminoacetate synthase